MSGAECWTNAEHEIAASLQLNPERPDARNLLGVIYAQEGKNADASLVWRELIRDVPDYEPASTNLAILGSPNKVASGETVAVDLPQRPPSTPSAIGTNRACLRRLHRGEFRVESGLGVLHFGAIARRHGFVTQIHGHRCPKANGHQEESGK